MPLSPKNSRGFSLLEIIVVVVLIGILSALAMPTYIKTMNAIRMHNASKTIKMQLLIAKSRAIANTSEHCGVFFDVSTNPMQSLVFTRSSPAYTDYGVGDVIYQQPAKLPIKVTMTLDIDPPTTNTVIFRGDGTAKSGARIAVCSPGISSDTVHVLASTGRI
ncbi:MAG: prepilin-type N-terminal cleavage/methylation domain-containing protein, partial [Chitinivibrionales bacterium]|nr:prepilin-type N-terminal cleavage/methylation domain-containing protein [Chitinivibrionales bacterium]